MNLITVDRDMETTAQRIESRRVALKLSKTDVWKGAGLSSGVYAQWMNGSKLTGENLIKVARILQVTPTWLETGKGEMVPGNEANADLTLPSIFMSGDIVSSERFLTVPLLNARASMGPGDATPDDEVVIDLLRVSRDWVAKALGPISNINNLAFIHAIGDSMAPTFNDGDILLVDTGNKTAASDKVYVLEAHNRLFIKRVRQRLDGAFEVSSDNPAVKTVDVLNGDHQVVIKGRIVYLWNGRRI
ncbi:XRE family transcriptional regulator [Pseudomethylobacillus aquaticus]|uniref:XRE family transcriptional regulator n=1 Tax=Pseudomethylobacillus aquaticus TaxID=2676064 RepID=A0A3N0V596_9PROT|nr:S24 family peptidase [Pseudomethylobacillus aquaticus]ROH87977.1 XRE family transcriptional regulator [Pseudomethylobacillus aquaticus]